MSSQYDQTRSTLTVAEALVAIQQGQMVLICDDESRENEADVCLPAQFVTATHVNFLIHQVCGLVCVALSGERLTTLAIPQQEHVYDPLHGTPFTVSVDVREGTTTGTPASDRAHTIRRLLDPEAQAHDFARPGHVFPLCAHPQGTFGRRGHTEAAVDLMKLAGLLPGAVLCEALDGQGESARGDRLLNLARTWNIGIITVESIAQARAEAHRHPEVVTMAGKVIK